MRAKFRMIYSMELGFLPIDYDFNQINLNGAMKEASNILYWCLSKI